MTDTRLIEQIALGVVIASWLSFVVFFLFFHKRPKNVQERKRETSWRWGFLLQMAGFALEWSVRRPEFTPIVPGSQALEIALAAMATVLGPLSAWFCFASARALGQQFALTARTVQGHQLVEDGPYRVVRNPIYLALFGVLVATGLAVSRWWALLCAITVFLIGNSLRIHAEEKLLREQFGEEFDDYARRVPAMFPRLFT